MTPPGGAGNRDNGNGDSRVRNAEIIEFPRSATAEPTPESSPQPSGSRSSSIPPSIRPGPSWAQFSDFNGLLNLTQGAGGQTSSGPYGRIQLYLETLANISVRGGYDTHFARQGQHFQLLQEKPGDPIRVRLSSQTSARGNPNPQMNPKFELVYYPDGRIGHSSTFDSEGKIQGERTFTGPDRLRSAALSDHTSTVEFLTQRQTQLGRSFGAFQRLQVPLRQLHPTQLDLGNRALWYRNFVVLNGEVYSIQTQNLGFNAFDQFPSQNQIAIFKHSGGRFEEVMRISQTGEINYNPEISARQLPTTRQLEFLQKLADKVELAHQNPQAYQESLRAQLETLSKSLATEIQIPRVEHTRSQVTELTSTRGTMGEPILEITRGDDLFRQIRPGFPETHRWENPENIQDVRQLRARGSIRWAMTRELLRWFSSTLWHGTINDVRNFKPIAGNLRLHLFPDGSADLEIHRNYDRVLRDGSVTQERGLYNYLRRSADGSTINLGDLIKQMSRGNPEFADLPRAEQLTRAARTITDAGNLTRALEIQEIPPLRISNLEVGPTQLQLNIDKVLQNSPGTAQDSIPRGPRTARQAAEIIQQLPDLQGKRARMASETTHMGREIYFEFDFPSSHPQTRIEVTEEAHQLGKRVIVRLWQGHGGEMSTAVYDDGVFNNHESARLNMAELTRAQQGQRQPPGLIRRAGKFGLQAYSHVRVYGLAYGLGHLASFPGAWLYEGLAWSEGERQAIGTPYPEMSLGALWGGSKDFFAMLGGAGTGSIITDGVFNYGGGMANVIRDWRTSGASFAGAYRLHAPRVFNAPPVSYRPLPKQMLYLRNFLQRGVPLFAGLLAVEMLHNGGPFGLNWDRLGHGMARIGAVSFGSAGLWALASHRTEIAVARQVSGQPIRGMGGFLLRNRFLTRAAPGVGGARFAMTMRSTIITVALEMVALRIWDSYDRRQQLLAQEGSFRGDLSRAMDRRSRIMSRLEYGEAIPPAQILGAQQAVEDAYQRYRSFLGILERSEGSGSPPEIPLANAYGEIHERYENEYLALQGLHGPQASNLLGRAQAYRDQQLREIRSGEQRTRDRLNRLYESHQLPVQTEVEGEGLREWLARTTRMLQNNPSSLDRALQAGENEEAAHTRTAPPPVSLDSGAGREIVEHINWQISQDASFTTWNRERQAQWILDEFSGYQVTEANGTTRPWNLGEATAFLNALDRENTQRANRLETPLTSAAGSSDRPNANLEEVAREEDRIIGEENARNTHLTGIQSVLANNISDLDRQMNDYHRRTNNRIDRALLQFMPQELFADASIR